MRSTILGVAFLAASSAARLAAAPCAPSDTALCLNTGRFGVAVHWQDTRGRSGEGHAVALTADTGYFWFFSPSNIELVVKVLDARSVNGNFWVFFGALSNVQYDLTVTDSATGSVKTYHNAQGQFASVGDTNAFAGSVDAPPVNETVDVAGSPARPESVDAIQRFIDAASGEVAEKQAAAFTPCAEGAAFLYLANCRFRVDVHWTDSHGRHGAGQAVQLTSDTGYFWFFSSTNVELMVKVLDARAVNGKFWVFFGALSNVQYTINVVDTVSGALHAYENPQGAFASIGDTAAFRGGYGIAVAMDEALAVSGLISADAGGSLSATSADGTVFTLLIPPDSLLEDELVTMTPAQTAGAFPFAGGLAAGMDIRPSGTWLAGGATLSIRTPTPLTASQETPVAWNGKGEDFYLFPPNPAGGDLELDVSHFGGYGIARATDAERQAQLEREPVADGDLLDHRLSPFLRQGRAEARGGSSAVTTRATSATATIWREETRSILDSRYGELATRMRAVDGDLPGVVVDLTVQGISWIREVEQVLGPVNTVFPPDRLGEIRSLFRRMISLALQKIHERCSEDSSAAFDIRFLADLIRVANVSDLDGDLQKTIKCLTFKLRFQSTIVVSGDQDFRYDVLAPEIPLRPTIAADGRIRVRGEGPLSYTSIGYPSAKAPCSVTDSESGSTFKAELHGSRAKAPHLFYDIGSPHDAVTYHCPATPVLPALDFGPKDSWPDDYRTLHSYEFGDHEYPLSVSGWIVTGQKAPWALKIIAKAVYNIQESTTFTLVHTPE